MPTIYISNHPTTLDPWFILRKLPKNTVCLVTENAFRVPLVARWLRKHGHIPVREQGGSYELALAALIAGKSVLIFPEGVLSNNNTELRTGALRLAMETGCIIVPVQISYIGPVLKIPWWTGRWEEVRIPLGVPKVYYESP